MKDAPVAIRVITWLPVGGIERRLVAVAPMLRDRGWRMRVVCIREEGPLAAELRDQGIPVEVIPFRSRLSPTALRKLSSCFRKYGADVVHTHMYRANIPGSIAARAAGVKGIFGHIHNVDSWDNGRQVFMDRLTCGLRTATFAVSEAVQRDVMRRLNLPESRVPVLYNGIDVNAYQPDPTARERFRKELGVPDDCVVFVVPARLHPQKNPEGVIAACEAVAKKAENFRLYFAGDGKLRDELRSLVSAHGMDSHVFFLGSRDDMSDVYNGADAMVLSSFKEGFSNAVVEALACGKPVIASAVGGNREAIHNGKVGWIHDAGNMGALAEQMLQAVERGVDGLAGMGTDCRARAERFSLESLVEETHRHYCGATGRTP